MIVSIDGAASAMDYIRQEYVDMTVDNSPLALATIAVKAVLTKTVKGEELGGGVTKVNASVITKRYVDEADCWVISIWKTDIGSETGKTTWEYVCNE